MFRVIKLLHAIPSSHSPSGGHYPSRDAEESRDPEWTSKRSPSHGIQLIITQQTLPTLAIPIDVKTTPALWAEDVPTPPLHLCLFILVLRRRRTTFPHVRPYALTASFYDRCRLLVIQLYPSFYPWFPWFLRSLCGPGWVCGISLFIVTGVYVTLALFLRVPLLLLVPGSTSPGARQMQLVS